MKLINFGVGEISDRLSILALKLLYGAEQSRDTTHWRNEQSALLAKIAARTLNASWFENYTELAAVNAAIWENEDRIRELRQHVDNGGSAPTARMDAFRSQRLNDRRNELIEIINKETGDYLGTEKLT